jgi:photosystem II stability/assembly factor-like uncharacterized protein
MCRFAVKAFLVLSVLIAAVGCRSTPVYNLTNQSIGTAGGKAKSLQEVKTAIVEAGKARGWTVRDIAPGHLEAELRLRGHAAVVDIKYSTTSYSITHKNSTNLNYDGTNIHPNYNSWIQNLQRDIENRL